MYLLSIGLNSLRTHGRAWAAGLLSALFLFLTLSGAAQTAPSAPSTLSTPATPTAPTAPTAPTGVTIRGHIADPSGALIPGAKVTIANALGVAITTTKSDAAGVYNVSNLPAGSYIVEASMDGFAPFTSPTLQLTAGQRKHVDISMAVFADQQNVVVSDDEGPHVSVEADSNANAVVLKDKDLDALSDDPDELQNELTALAGPAAGPNGGQIYIDGFTGGTLPPKSAIREIRINQNPFSAEYDHIGYGRIEILTKPGTDKFHARGFIQGNDDAFNTGNPFSKLIPAYHAIQYNANVSGSLGKTASYFLTVEGRNTQDASIYSAYLPVLSDSVYSVVPVSGGLFNPSSRIEVSPRLDLQLGQKNTLTMRFQFERSNSTNGGTGSTTLPSAAYDSSSSEYSFQFSDSILINDRMATEFRGQFRRSISSQTPVSTAPTVGVSGYFSGGGSSSQYSTDHSDHMELQNTTTMTAGTHAIKTGFWLRDNRDANDSDANYNGSFSFSSLASYVATLNGTPSATSLTYATGNQKFEGNTFDSAVFVQDDWKTNRFLTLSGGLRLEMQNHINDHLDIAPRFAFAYALDGHKKGAQSKTVLRGGFGFFYDRFGVSNLMNLERDNGGANSQKTQVITSPQCFNATSLSSITLSSCGSGSAVSSQIYALESNYRSPYNEQYSVSIERQLTKTTTLTGTYIHSFGLHQSATINANPYTAISGTDYYNSSTGSRLNASEGLVDEIYPEAVFKQSQLIVNANAHISPRFNLMGFYVFGHANTDSTTASNSYDLSQDYGRAAFVRRNMLYLMSSYTGPWGVSFNPFLVAQAGHPYNIVTNTDLTGDNFYNDRPAYATSSDCSQGSSRYVQTGYGCLDVQPGQNESLIPINLANGPAAVAVNLRINRSIGLGAKTGQASSGNDQKNQKQGSYMSGPGGGPGGGHGGGGGRGGPGGGTNNTGHKYALTFSVAAMNLFNDIDYGTPSGSIVPTLNSSTGNYGPGSRFGKSTALAGGMFASPSNSAARRIFIQAAFNF
ncbi:carboxypeptidase regulatory-like domain-containing protein [Telmatobacter bradus]|uniref:TonB-dependent receptor n=1 Tax=Telmatobacter bradus TaxID=474953 RepID=UPI003B439B29